MCLGGFHTKTSFALSVYLTGPQEILDLICAPTAVVYMLIGKAIAQAVCATFIVNATLNALILRSVLNATLP